MMQVANTDCFNDNLGKLELSLDEKYNLYRNSVYNMNKDDIIYLNRLFTGLKRKTPKVLREDFCGVFSLGILWVNYARQNKAICIDKDSEPLDWGKKNPIMKMDAGKWNRLSVIKDDVRFVEIDGGVDVALAGNWSQQVFMKRKEMVDYFRNVYLSLNDDGIFLISNVNSLLYNTESVYIEDRIYTYKDKVYRYFFEIQKACPFTHLGLCKIHFVRDNKIATPFVYPWRVWTIAEYLDILSDVGFARATVQGLVEDTDNLPPGYKPGYHPVSVIEEDKDEMELSIVAEKRITD